MKVRVYSDGSAEALKTIDFLESHNITHHIEQKNSDVLIQFPVVFAEGEGVVRVWNGHSQYELDHLLAEVELTDK